MNAWIAIFSSVPSWVFAPLPFVAFAGAVFVITITGKDADHGQ